MNFNKMGIVAEKVKKPRLPRTTNKIKEGIDFFFQELEDNAERSNVSCGIYDIDEVDNAFINTLDESSYNNDGYYVDKNRFTEEEYLKFKEYLKNNFRTLLYTRLLQNNYNNRSWAFYNISLNHGANKDLIEILDANCITSTPWRKNHNSGNNIKIWLF